MQTSYGYLWRFIRKLLGYEMRWTDDPSNMRMPVLIRSPQDILRKRCFNLPRTLSEQRPAKPRQNLAFDHHHAEITCFSYYINKSDPQDVRCTTPQSWQGNPLRVPVASLRPWLFLGTDPIQSHQNVSPFHHSRETSLSLHPSIKGAIAPLVKSTRQGNSPRHLPIRGAFLLPPIPP